MCVPRVTWTQKFAEYSWLCSVGQVWQLGSSSPNFTLEGHEKGVNCIDYYSGGDKPYLISGADDRLVKIWDYQVCAQLLSSLCAGCHIQYKVSVVRLFSCDKLIPCLLGLMFLD